MHFSRHEQLKIGGLIAVFWISFQMMWFAFHDLARDEAMPATDLIAHVFASMAAPSEIVIVLAGAVICYLVYLALSSVRRRAFWQQLFSAAAATFVSAFAFALSISFILRLFDVPWPAPTMRFLAFDTLRWFSPFGLWAGVALAVTYSSEVAERERRLASLRLYAQEAQTRALRYQVNPHLLYNTLNSIAALILDGQNERAEAMVLRLSDFFRASLAIDPNSDVSLGEELALQRLYLDIEQMRFPYLSSSFDVEAGLENALVPSLILQPLLENVVKHAIHADRSPTKVTVRASSAAGKLTLVLEDTGPGSSSQSGTGIGIANVRERLLARFGSQASLETSAKLGEGFRVTIMAPLLIR